MRDNSTYFADNEPPFFLRNSSSSETPPEVQHTQLDKFLNEDLAGSLPLHTGLLQLGTDGGSTEDFRGVIDDLTVENKKLKRRLKKYEKLHDSHLKDEKLFEVRIHGMPPEKKRELEETLRKFTSDLGNTGAKTFSSNGYESILPMLKTSKTVSSQASLQHADSAYASMSASGQGSSARSGVESKSKITPTNYLASRNKNIHSYLHHIREGLLPQQNPGTMTERAKKKLVVRRMEQVFAGKGAAADAHQQSLQQQEVSQSAARVDRFALEASGLCSRQEGSREAHIMDHETEDPLNLGQDNGKQSPDQPIIEKEPEEKSVAYNDFANGTPSVSNLDQRPARPLDLDPHRAQVPSENIRYMRQMGFSPPEPDAGKSPEEGHGWIYLNFLINMAQLHTVNVTSDFVRKALGEYSNKLELSQDGRKVRWRGGRSVTRTSSSGGGSSNDRVGDDTPDGQSPRKRPKLTHMDSVRSNMTGGSQQIGGPLKRLRAENNKHVYTPLFFHKDSTDEEEDSSSEEEEEDTTSLLPAPAGGDSSGMASSGMRNTTGIHTTTGIPAISSKKKQKRDEGPIIFYNNARFCTDLSGDRKPEGNYNAPVYVPSSSIPVGKHGNAPNRILEMRGPLAEASKLPEPMDLSDNPIPESMEVSIPPRSPSQIDSLKEQSPIDLEVTGIGGVWPTDNFAISVESRHARIEQQRAPDVITDVAPKSLPPRFAQIVRGSDGKSQLRPTVHEQIVASKVHDLPPSELPPAMSFMGYDDESMSDDESDFEDDASETPESLGALPPVPAPQPVDIPYALSDDEDEDDDEGEDEEESDGEVDFLAAAREIDPETVRQKEREYDANLAERLAEETPAGSSAATAGGGSGFTSPATGFEKEAYLRAMREARAKAVPAPMKRARTGDSMLVQGENDSSNSESEDEDMSDIRS